MAKNWPRSSGGVISCGRLRYRPKDAIANTAATASVSQGARRQASTVERVARVTISARRRQEFVRTPPSAPEDVLLAPASSLAAIIGLRVRAVIDETATAKARTKPNSANSPPAWPGRKEIGTKTAISVAVVESTAKTTSREPMTAAARRPRPSPL